MRANVGARVRRELGLGRRMAMCLCLVAIAERAAAQGTTFVPGTRELFVMDLNGLKKDELPKGITAKGKEKPSVVTKDGVPVLRAAERTELLVRLPENLPSAFTIQFEITPKPEGAPEDLSFEGTVERNRGDASMEVLWQISTLIAVGGGDYFQIPMPDSIGLTLAQRPVPIEVSFDGGAFRLFTDGKLLMDLSNRQFVRGRILRVALGGGCNEADKCVTPDIADKYSVYLSKLRIAAGGGVVANNNTQNTNQPISPATNQSLDSPLNRNTIPKTFTVTVTAGPQGPVVSWPLVAQANGYAVSRRKIDDANCCNNSSGSAYGASSPWQDAPLPASGTYVYRVIANTPAGQIAGETQFGFRKPEVAATTTSVSAVPVDPPTTGTITPMSAPPPSQPSTVTTSTIADRSAPLSVPAGPAPTLAVDGIPNLVMVMWDSVPGTVRYEVAYAAVGTTNWSQPAIPQPDPIRRKVVWVGTPPDPRTTYTYRVIAYQADGKAGEARADYKTPTMEPTNFTATPVAPGQVRFEWDDIQAQWQSNVVSAEGTLFGYHGDQITYFLSGPGTGVGMQVVGTTKSVTERNSFTLTGVPAGVQTWNLTVNWNPGGVITPSTSWAKASATVAADPLPRYRLVALGFKAVQQSKDIDDANDGHGDEVYFAAVVNRTQLTGDTLPATKAANLSIAMTRSHGDEAVRVPYGRIKAGTASPTGGIKTGDVIPASLDLAAPTGALQTLTFPLLLWEGSLKDSDAVVVHPTLWEDDVNPVVQAMWAKAIFEAAASGYRKEPPDPYYGADNNGTGVEIQRLAGTKAVYAPTDTVRLHERGSFILECSTLSANLIRRPCEAHGVDRPLGLVFDSPSQWLDHLVVLTSAAVGQAVASDPRNPGWRSGTFGLKLYDKTPPGNDAVALYELYLRLERVP